jgi:hypothetical protein
MSIVQAFYITHHPNLPKANLFHLIFAYNSAAVHSDSF